MKRNKVVQVLMAVVLAVGVLFAAAPQNAWAANTGDTVYKFKFSGTDTHGTSGRKKTDTTAVYVRVDVFTVEAVNFYVDGGTSSTGPWVNLTNNGKARLTQKKHSNHGNKYSIHTQVYETGRRWARLTGWTDGYKGRVEGVWSPDSMYSYYDLN